MLHNELVPVNKKAARHDCDAFLHTIWKNWQQDRKVGRYATSFFGVDGCFEYIDNNVQATGHLAVRLKDTCHATCASDMVRYGGSGG